MGLKRLKALDILLANYFEAKRLHLRRAITDDWLLEAVIVPRAWHGFVSVLSVWNYDNFLIKFCYYFRPLLHPLRYSNVFVASF